MAERKLGFIEINKGKLGLDIQQDFEEAAMTARMLNGKCEEIQRKFILDELAAFAKPAY